ncbi:MAG TPA: GDP-mannose 4,6-dehydratase [Gemmatimonadaceae bacterium]|nr:GDP-mannose 4,6-dehydratase [Gemmatimonadaceae bacterium]
MRALVTGAAGFVGQFLARALLREGWEVYGTNRFPDEATPALTESERAAVRWLTLDVRRIDEWGAALDGSRPEAVFHLAAITFVPAAGNDPALACETNVCGPALLLSAVRERHAAGTLDPLVLVTGSGEQYGRHDPAEMPLREDAEQRPLSVYAVTKVAQEALAMQAFRADGVRVLATRSFNHSGAGQAGSFLLPSLVKRALAIRAERGAGARAEIAMGNLGATRDFLHVEDVVRAYILLAARGTPGEAYNVCSGVGTRSGEMAVRVGRRVGIEATPFADPAFVRRVEVEALVGDSTRLRRATGWEPTRSVDDIIDDLIHAATH